MGSDVCALKALAEIETVLFDLDGTLVAPTIDFEAMNGAVRRLARAFGYSEGEIPHLPALETIALVRGGLAERSAERAAAFEAAAQQALVDIEVEASRRARAYEGVVEMLQTLAERGLRVGIVTRNCRLAVEEILRRNPLRYEVLLTREDVLYVKPDPRHLLAALERLNGHSERTAMCGDHPMDIRAGRAIGAVTVGVLRPGVGPEVFAGEKPDLILSRVADLPHYLGARPPLG
ncbi:MAG: HAD family hydrolase [Chloroflexi bacterium]|nr:HAD family hydrolase [Chloroflexota bacterium]